MIAEVATGRTRKLLGAAGISKSGRAANGKSLSTDDLRRSRLERDLQASLPHGG